MFRNQYRTTEVPKLNSLQCLVTQQRQQEQASEVKMSSSGGLQPQPPSSRRSQRSGSARSRASRFGRTNSKSSRAGGGGYRRTITQDSERSEKPPLQLLDAAGNDMTPRSLLNPSQSLGAVDKQKNAGFALSSEWKGSLSGNNSQSKLLSASGFGVSFKSSLSSSGHSSLMSTTSDQPEPSSEDDEAPETSPAAVAKPVAVETVSDEDLVKPVTLYLTETETFWMLDIPSTWVAADGPDADDVKASNERYEDMVKKHVTAKDSFSERPAQTFNNAKKNKDAQFSGVHMVTAGCQATTADLHDTFVALDVRIKTGKADQFAVQTTDGDSDLKYGHEGEDDQEGTSRVFTDPLADVSAVPALDDEQILASPSLKDTLRLAERLVTHGVYKEAQLRYKGVEQPAPVTNTSSPLPQSPVQEESPQADNTSKDTSETPVTPEAEPDQATKDIPEPAEKEVVAETVVDPATGDAGETATSADSADSEPSLKPLWSFSCAETEGRTITCLTWNKTNPDLLAVGYGCLEFSDQDSGLVCCWSLKNPEYPERVYRLPTGCTSLDFGTQRPNLLAMGWYDGTVALYDVSTSSQLEPVIDTREKPAADKHAHPVWDLRWTERDSIVAKGDSKDEVLVSVSTDGRVLQWSTLKGLDSTELMRVQRVANSSKASHKGNAKAAFLARQAHVMSLAFSKVEPNNYFIGTEDGNIHKCSCAYTEQFIANYFGHQGPVYSIHCSPAAPEVLLSCSSDWSIRLWNNDDTEKSTVLETTASPVLDAVWSPTSPTMIGSVSSTSLSLWDLSVKEKDPLLTMSMCTEDCELTCLSFAPSGNVVLTGDTSGRVTVNQIVNVLSDMSREDQVAKLKSLVA